jgi:hypothetical protein
MEVMRVIPVSLHRKNFYFRTLLNDATNLSLSPRLTLRSLSRRTDKTNLWRREEDLSVSDVFHNKLHSEKWCIKLEPDWLQACMHIFCTFHCFCARQSVNMDIGTSQTYSGGLRFKSWSEDGVFLIVILSLRRRMTMSASSHIFHEP